MPKANIFPKLISALCIYILAIVCIAMATIIEQPWVLVLLLGANALSMSAISHASGFAAEEKLLRSITQRGVAWLVLFTALSALLWALIALPTIALASSLSTQTLMALGSVIILALVILWPSWAAFGLIFVWHEATASEGQRSWIFTTLKHCLTFAWHLRKQSHWLRHFLPASIGLLILATGALVLSSPDEMLPAELRTASLWIYGLILLPVIDLVLINRTLQVLLGKPATPSSTIHQDHAAPDRTQDAPQPESIEDKDIKILNTQLMAAIDSANADSVRTLIEAGADVNAVHRRGSCDYSPLMLASQLSDHAILRLLIEAGANINQKVEATSVLVHLAQQVGEHTAQMAMLLANGADIQSRDKHGHSALHYAAMHGNLDDCARLIDAGADIDQVSQAGFNALSLASKQQQWQAVKWLLEHHASVDQESAQPALLAAAGSAEDNPQGVDLLLAHKADINRRNKQGRSALIEAASQHNLTIATHLINAGADIALADQHGITALMEASRQGATSIVDALLEADADVNVRDHYDRNALVLAAQSSSTRQDTIHALIRAGSNPYAEDENGRSAIDVARAAKRDDLADIMDKKPARKEPAKATSNINPITHLLDALRFGHWHIVNQFQTQMQNFSQAELAHLYIELADAKHPIAQNWLLAHGLLATSKLANGRTLLSTLLYQLPDSLAAFNKLMDAGAHTAGKGHLAVAMQKFQHQPAQAYRLIARMLSQGADPFGADDKQKTPLHYAVIPGFEPIMKRLLEQGVNPNVCDREGKSPLYTALTYPQAQVATIKQLVSAGANPELGQANGETPLGLAMNLEREDLAHFLEWPQWTLPQRRLRDTDLPEAAMQGDLAAINKLLALGLDVNSSDARGANALIHAAALGHDTMLETLIKHGANPSLATPEGITPLLAAINTRHNQSVKLLLDNGSQANESIAGHINALMLACGEGHADIAATLLAAGSPIDDCDENGRSALAIASQYCFAHTDSLRCHRLLTCLLDANANVNLADHQALTPLLRLLGTNVPPGSAGDATHLGALIPLLLDAGSDVNQADKQGNSPLHACAMHVLLSPARILLAHGANPKATDEKGRRPVDVAKQLGYVDMAMELEPR